MCSSFAEDVAPPLLTAFRQETNALDHFRRRGQAVYKSGMAVSSVPLAPCAERSERKDAALVLVLAATLLLWSSAFVGIRYAVRHYPPGSLALLRFLVASLLLGGYALLRKPASGARPSLKDWGAFFALGATGVFGYHIALNFGERTVEAGAASLLVNTTPLFTVLLAVAFLGERLTVRGALGLAVAFGGATMVALGAANGLTLDKGALLVLAAAVIQAFYFALQKPMLGRFGALDLTTRSIWCGTLLLSLFLPELASTLREAPLSSTLVVLFLGVGPSCFAYAAWAYIVSKMSVSRAVGYLYLVPALALGTGFLVLGETPGFLALAGGVLTILGVTLVRGS
jgi:drug/metabolite transporter (DMT)-like permease